MWSSVGPEFSGVIDPQLKWKTSSNAKHRALRRARTFSQYNGKKFTAKNTEDIDDIFDEDLKNEGDVLVSESEKFGVNVLGQRFSGNLQSVPIKKRRFSLLPPESSPHILSSAGFDDNNHGDRLALLENIEGSLKQDDSDIYSSQRVDCGQGIKSANENMCLENIDELTSDSADFSGISILAAAACNCSIEKGFMDANDTAIKGHSFEKISSLLLSSESIEGKDQTSKLELGNISKSPVGSFFTAMDAVGREPDQVKLDECKEKNSVGFSHNFSRRKSVSLRDDRLHWDLNTVMDTDKWESQSDDLSSPDSLNASVKSHGSQDREHGKRGIGQDDTVFGINKVELIAADNRVSSHCFEEIEQRHTSPVADRDEGNCCLSKTQVCEPLQECQFKDVIVIVEKSTAGCGAEVDAHAHDTLSSLIITGNATPGQIMNEFDPLSEDKNVKELLHDDSMSIATLGSSNGHSKEFNLTYVEKDIQLRSPRSEKHESVSADVAICFTEQKSPTGQFDQSTSGIIIRGDENTLQVSLDGSNSKSMTTYGFQADETAYITESGKAFAYENLSTVHFSSNGTSDNNQLPSRDKCVGKCKGTSDLKADDCNSCILSGECLTSERVVPFHSSPELTNSASEGLMLARNGISLDGNILTFREDCRTSADGLVSCSFKDSLKEQLDSEHYSYSYPIDTDRATVLEKVDFLEDYDSQYEDGELRESVLNSWGEDEVEEVETEHVDYGSDGREADIFEAESDFCSQFDLADGTAECKHEGKSISSFSDGSKLRVTEDDSSAKCFQKHANSGESDTRKIPDVCVVSEFPARDENRSLSLNIPADDVPGKSRQPDSSRMKSSGWDNMPRREDTAAASATTSVNGKYTRRKAVSSIKCDSFSRVERSKSSEASCRKESSYATESKKLGHFELNAERSTIASRSIRRGRLPFRSHGRGRVDCWVGSPDHHGICRLDTSGYYSSPNFAPPGSRNAAAAAVAKVESNGFVVASDGTIVKPGCTGSSSHLSACSSNSTSHLQSTRRGSTMESNGAFRIGMPSEPANSTREVSPDRCFNVARERASRYDPRFISLGHSNMYKSSMLDQSLQHPSSRRQRSFSPQRTPIHLSREHTRSPSRSNIGSPHCWIPSREREISRINGDPDIRRQSRSPPCFKGRKPIPRQRLPQRHLMPTEDFPAYAPSSRSHSSPSHASRWFDEEGILHGQLREHRPRCSAGRSSPSRNFLQDNRLDRIDSRGRVKPDECCQPICSGRFHEYSDCGRGSKPDCREDGRRGQNIIHESFHSGGHMERNVNMKYLCYGKNGFRSHNLQPKSSWFQRRESPRTFDRSIDSRREDSPRRFKGEMFHFKRSSDGKLNTDFKSFGVRDTTGEIALQRRPS